MTNNSTLLSEGSGEHRLEASELPSLRQKKIYEGILWLGRASSVQRGIYEMERAEQAQRALSNVVPMEVVPVETQVETDDTPSTDSTDIDEARATLANIYPEYQPDYPERGENN